MGLLDFLIGLFTAGGSKIQCPSCGAQGARKSSDGLIHCGNPTCPYFDPALRRGTRGQAGSSVPTRGDFHPEHPLAIRYRNSAGQERTFTAERDSIVRKQNHLVARVVPTGRKITLSRDRIQNLNEVEASIPQRVAAGQPWPTPRERQILNYHKKHGSTSARYEQVRAKFPNW
ncbi:MAG TPA: hypothetical protein VJQ54_07380 [Candidatus Sulfotelmatobacter sp.]|nr:hypothetical protein [Candidatus Sulfotelmatobacter sp.]